MVSPPCQDRPKPGQCGHAKVVEMTSTHPRCDAAMTPSAAGRSFVMSALQQASNCGLTKWDSPIPPTCAENPEPGLPSDAKGRIGGAEAGGAYRCCGLH